MAKRHVEDLKNDLRTYISFADGKQREFGGLIGSARCHGSRNLMGMPTEVGLIRERITIRLTKQQMESLNELVNKGMFLSKNEAMRSALSLLFERYKLQLAKED